MSHPIIVKYHAVEQYRKRAFASPNLTDQEIKNFLVNIVLNGTIKNRRPGEEIYKVSYQGHAVVLKISPNKKEIITYLGNETYQLWYKTQEYKIRRRNNKNIKKPSGSS